MLFSIGVVMITSCTTRVTYKNKDGSNDILIYKDSLFSIQRSTELFGDKLMVSHLINRVNSFSDTSFSIDNIADIINNISYADSMSLYESCSFKTYSYKTFTEIPSEFRSLQNCASYQIIYYYPIEKIVGDDIIVNTSLKFSIRGKNCTIKFCKGCKWQCNDGI
jgi:hypothetical protein